MEIIRTALDGVVEIRAKRHGDERGWFSETFKRDVLHNAGIDIDFVQDNESFSAPTGLFSGGTQRTPLAIRQSVRVTPSSGRLS